MADWKLTREEIAAEVTLVPEDKLEDALHREHFLLLGHVKFDTRRAQAIREQIRVLGGDPLPRFA